METSENKYRTNPCLIQSKVDEETLNIIKEKATQVEMKVSQLVRYILKEWIKNNT